MPQSTSNFSRHIGFARNRHDNINIRCGAWNTVKARCQCACKRVIQTRTAKTSDQSSDKTVKRLHSLSLTFAQALRPFKPFAQLGVKLRLAYVWALDSDACGAHAGTRVRHVN